MPYPPNRLIEEAFLAPTVEVIRRVEIYEYDGETPWKPELWPYILVGGNVNVSSDQDSRRSADFEFYNEGGELTPEAGKFWYDKIIKAYYGIVTHKENEGREPSIIIIEEESALNQGVMLKKLLSEAGVHFVEYNPLIDTLAEVQDYDILVSISGDYTRKLPLLTAAYTAGKSVLTFGLNSTAAQLPLLITSTSAVRSGDDARHFENAGAADPASAGWDSWNVATPGSYRPIVATPGVTVALEQRNSFGLGAVLREGAETGVWIHTQMAKFDNSVFADPSDREGFIEYLAAIVNRADTYDIEKNWEAQVGEFIPEAISDGGDVITNTITVTARDYAKRCQSSKLAKATLFPADQSIIEIIKALANNSNVFKTRLPETLNIKLGKDTTYERDQDRWTVMKEIAVANNMDLWFDNEGYLRLTPQNDPLLTPATLQLTTGDRGNLISRGRKTSDAGLFNHVTVVGESSDKSVPLVFGEAANNDPLSPSSIQRIGWRTKNISSPLITSDQQAQEIANTMLSVSSLEEFELDFSSILFPWVEAGEILEMNEDIAGWAPARYLITSLTLPFDLSPMTGTGKRVTKL
ncbi:hypothetical protein GMA3_18 [Gordonia phage GMA3]|uniref:Minor tail protein n=1 Tax=Gordonia phage GMA3 TaxID=1647284 RepID=A0A0K0NKH4_9CAUD|nr:hypothetical protein AU105_gp018 [Gordonia phage GMA3]AKL88195.1 hypothetical protein GMA3_18 [Gordonia phage GMA3]